MQCNTVQYRTIQISVYIYCDYIVYMGNTLWCIYIYIYTVFTCIYIVLYTWVPRCMRAWRHDVADLHPQFRQQRGQEQWCLDRAEKNKNKDKNKNKNNNNKNNNKKNNSKNAMYATRSDCDRHGGNVWGAIDAIRRWFWVRTAVRWDGVIGTVIGTHLQGISCDQITVCLHTNVMVKW